MDVNDKAILDAAATFQATEPASLLNVIPQSMAAGAALASEMTRQATVLGLPKTDPPNQFASVQLAPVIAATQVPAVAPAKKQPIPVPAAVVAPTKTAAVTTVATQMVTNNKPHPSAASSHGH